MPENASQIFELLENIAPAHNEFISRETGIRVDGRPVQIAIDSQSRPALLVPLRSDDSEIFDSASKGIRLDTFSIGGAEAGHRQLIVRCVEPSLRPQFGLLVDDMLGQLQREDVDSPGSACLVVLDRWRDLLGTVNDGLLGVEAQIGLLAELHVLEALQRTVGIAALDLWHGPDRKRHDFVSSSGSIEVKATLIRETFPVAIHGAQQLEQPATGSLVLYAEQYEEAPGGDSLADVVARILAEGINAPEFLQKLASVGFQLGDSPAYSHYQFATARRRICLVGHDFPQISSLTMRDPVVLDRITRLQYSVDISGVSALVPDVDALEEAVRILNSNVA